MIEPVLSAPRPRWTRAAAAGSALLLVFGVGVALVVPGDDAPDQLALAGGTADAAAERLSAPAPVGMAGDSSLALYPGFGGIEYRFDGEFPDLGSEAPAWEMATPRLGRDDVVRMAEALGLSGEPVHREGGWFVETSDGSFNLFSAGDGWSVNFNRTPAAGASGAEISAADAEATARSVLERMGVLSGEWRVETSPIEMGFGVGCAVPVDGGSPGGISPEEAAKLGIEEAVTVDPDTPVASPDTSVASPPPAADTVPCAVPEPPASTPAQSVSFFPVVDGVRAGWAGWGVTVRGDGRIENLYGTWATFERVGTFKLRDVEAAFDELSAGGDARPQPLMAEPAGGAPEPVVDPAMPSIVSPAPQVVTITGVERALIPMGVYSGSVTRLHLVPAYRFTGSFEGGEPFETSVVALHPDAIAPTEPGREPLVDPGGSGAGVSGGGSPGMSTPPAPPEGTAPRKG